MQETRPAVSCRSGDLLAASHWAAGSDQAGCAQRPGARVRLCRAPTPCHSGGLPVRDCRGRKGKGLPSELFLLLPKATVVSSGFPGASELLVLGVQRTGSGSAASTSFCPGTKHLSLHCTPSLPFSPKVCVVPRAMEPSQNCCRRAPSLGEPPAGLTWHLSRHL